MRIPRLSLIGCLFLVGLIAIDLGVVRYAMAPWETGGKHRQSLLNSLPMLNAIAIASFLLIRRRGEARPFTRGFLVGGVAALLLYAAIDRASPQTTWAVTDWLANRTVELFRNLGIAVSYMTYKSPAGLLHFRFYPAFALIVAAPQFLLAAVVGMVTRMSHGDASASEGLQRAGTA